MNRKTHFKTLVLAASIAASSLAAVVIAPAAYAYSETSTSRINVTADNVILKGHDPVAYFTAGQPTPGSEKFQTQYEGATYRFASADNLAAFVADPARYAPQYGGYCAMGAALGKKLDVDPTQFKVVDGKLYLNVNADVFKKWSEDIPTNIANADANWPAIRDKAPNQL